MSTKEPRTTFTISLSANELEMLKEVTAGSELAGMDVPRSMLIRFMIMSYGRMQKEITDTKAKLDTTVTAALAGARAGAKVKEAPLSYQEKKEAREKEERDRGLDLCKQLDGRCEGDVCYYSVYEITAAGYVVDGRRAENIYNLSEEIVRKQYDPSKEEWLKAKAEEDAKEAAKLKS